MQNYTKSYDWFASRAEREYMEDSNERKQCEMTSSHMTSLLVECRLAKGSNVNSEDSLH